MARPFIASRNSNSTIIAAEVRSTKPRLYATAGVAQYWLVNLPQSQVEVYEQPDSTTGKYAHQTILKSCQTLAWNLSPTQRLEINLSDLLR